MRHLFKKHVRTLLLSAFMVVTLAAYSQQLHFIYIQADNKQPFSVELNGKYYSSSSIGYIILPKLTDGTYNLTINFAKNSYPEQRFTITVAGKDYGYALKNFDDKGWGLFNFQTTDVLKSNSTAPDTSAGERTGTVTNTSAFGNMLADVVNDKSINTLSAIDTTTTVTGTKTKAAKNEEVTASLTFSDTVPAALDTTSSPIVQKKEPIEAADKSAEITQEDTLSETPVFATTGVIKAEENVGDKGTDLTFIDFNGEHNDTIKAFIPTAIATTSKKGRVQKDKDTINITATAATADSAKGKVDNPFFEQNSTAGNAEADAGTTATQPRLMEDTAATAPAAGVLANTTCNNMMSEGDLNRLKKRIVSQTDQVDILQTVKKNLKNKCITTSQVKDLGNLFLNDDNRYGFYDAVYPYVSDYSNYASLQSTLIDPYYKTRFKALLR